jgi:hypothetical protein
VIDAQAWFHARDWHPVGGFVLSPLPLGNEDKELRIQILDKDSHIVEAIKEWGWTPTYGGPHPRVSFTGLEPATIYKIEFPGERQPIHDDRTIRGEISGKRKPKSEVELMLKGLGYK